MMRILQTKTYRKNASGNSTTSVNSLVATPTTRVCDTGVRICMVSFLRHTSVRM